MHKDIWWEVTFRIIADGKEVPLADLPAATKEIILDEIRKGWRVGVIPQDAAHQ